MTAITRKSNRTPYGFPGPGPSRPHPTSRGPPPFSAASTRGFRGPRLPGGKPPSAPVVASTLHSLCLKILGKQDVLEQTQRTPGTLYRGRRLRLFPTAPSFRNQSRVRASYFPPLSRCTASETRRALGLRENVMQSPRQSFRKVPWERVTKTCSHLKFARDSETNHVPVQRPCPH